MKNYTYFFIMFGALVISAELLGETVVLPERQYPVSQKTETIRYVERQPQDVVPQQTEQQVVQPLRAHDLQPVGEGYYDKLGRWHYTDRRISAGYGPRS